MVKINFYIPRGDDYLNGKTIAEIQTSDYEFFVSSERAWIVQTYLHLRRLAGSVVCSDKLDHNAINVLHCDEMLNADRAREYFTVSAICDRRVHFKGNLSVVQNRDQIRSKRDYWIMHWPQGGLIPSDRQRDSRSLRIGFLGLERNSVDLKSLLGDFSFGKDLEILYKGEGQWHDYSDLDVVVAVRDFSSRHSHKPPTKLVNAWRAGVVFMGGRDSAYEQVGTPGVNYIKCESRYNLVHEIARLAESSELRRKFVAEGYLAASRYENQVIADQWLKFFETVAKPAFNQWCGSTPLRRQLFNIYRYFSYTCLRGKRFVLTKLAQY